MIDNFLLAKSKKRLAAIQMELDATYAWIRGRDSRQPSGSPTYSDSRPDLRERIIDEDDLLPINFLISALSRSEAVAKILLFRGSSASKRIFPPILIMAFFHMWTWFRSGSLIPVIIGTAKNVEHAVLSAVQSEYSVITMSMGSYGRRSWKEMAKYAYDNGVVWVCAAGNEVRKLGGMVVRPAKYKGTIAVAATNYQDKPWHYSSRGSAVDISAPGENVYVPVRLKDETYNYSYGSGTSYATPHIAAAVALWLHHHKKQIRKVYKKPWQRVEAFRYLLKKTARRPRGWNEKMGAGILDALALIKAELPDPKDLQHAYEVTPLLLESTADQPASITEKELFHYRWNNPPNGSQVLSVLEDWFTCEHPVNDYQEISINWMIPMTRH